MSVLMLVLGGSCGAVARHSLGVLMLRREKHAFPFGTLFINLLGSLILGVLSGLGLGGNWYAGGFCGAFTAFPTFSLGTVPLLRGHARGKAVLYLAVSLVFGVLLFAAGDQAGRLLRR